MASYPTLQHLKLIFIYDSYDQYIPYIPELESFFDRNPSLHTLSLRSFIFFNNINAMLRTKLQLRELAIYYFHDYDHEKFIRQLKTLHSQGFYQRLHLFVSIDEQQLFDIFSSLDALEMLFIYDYTILSPMFNLLPQLKYLNFYRYDETVENMMPVDFELIVKNLPNLEQISFNIVKSKTIEPFIQNSANLKSVIIGSLIDIRNLSSLNQKREQLFGARKVTIYPRQDAFLSTKWSNKTTNFKLITIRRFESCPTINLTDNPDEILVYWYP